MKKIIKFLSCVIWIILGGVWMAILWGLIGALLCITVVGIPFGVQCFKLAKFSFLPIGKQVDLNYRAFPVANTIWAMFGGWIMAILYLLFGIANFLTIFGIPTGIRCFKIMKLAIFPFGAKIKKI